MARKTWWLPLSVLMTVLVVLGIVVGYRHSSTGPGSRTEEAAMPGWDAIDAALLGVYGREPDGHYGTLSPWRLGGDAPLRGISAYRSDHGGTPHWHLVTYGYSELGAKETDDPTTSGYGFEMTMRLARLPGETEAPRWALDFLQNLAQYVFSTGNAFEAGHHLPFNGPIRLEGAQTEIVAGVLVVDSELAAIDTPNGRLQFLQIVGITDDEHEVARRWSSGGLVSLLRETNAALVTDPERTSLVRSAEMRRRIDEGIARDGSSFGTLFLESGSIQEEAGSTHLVVPLAAAPELRAAVVGRLRFSRAFTLAMPDGVVRLVAGDRSIVSTEGDVVEVVLDGGDQDALARIPENASVTTLPSGTLRVETY